MAQEGKVPATKISLTTADIEAWLHRQSVVGVRCPDCRRFYPPDSAHALGYAAQEAKR